MHMRRMVEIAHEAQREQFSQAPEYSVGVRIDMIASLPLRTHRVGRLPEIGWRQITVQTGIEKTRKPHFKQCTLTFPGQHGELPEFILDRIGVEGRGIDAQVTHSRNQNSPGAGAGWGVGNPNSERAVEIKEQRFHHHCR